MRAFLPDQFIAEQPAESVLNQQLEAGVLLKKRAAIPEKSTSFPLSYRRVGPFFPSRPCVLELFYWLF